MTHPTPFKKIYTAQALGLISIFAFTVLTIFGQTPKANEAQNITLNQAVERTIKGGETQNFQFKLKAGEYARAEVEQKNIDVVVSLFDSNGKLVIEMDGKDGRLWREVVSVIAEKNGTYRVEIKAYGAAEMAGSYTVKLAEQRESAVKDTQRIEAERHLSAGRRLYEKDREKFQEAVKEYEAAISLWRKLIEAEQEAITLVNIGWTYTELSKYEQAIAAQTRATELFQKTKDRIGEGKAINGIGNAFNSLKQYDKSLEIYEKNLAIRKEIGDRQGESKTLSNLGNVYASLKQLEKARDYYEQALSVKRELKDVSGQISLLSDLTYIYAWTTQSESKKKLEYIMRISS